MSAPLKNRLDRKNQPTISPKSARNFEQGTKEPRAQKGQNFLLASGERVCNQISECSVPTEVLKAVLGAISGGANRGQIKESVDLSTIPDCLDRQGMVQVVSIRLEEKDFILWAERPNGRGFAPFLVRPRKEAEYSNFVTVTLERHRSTYSLVAAYWGPALPPKPGDENGFEREWERLHQMEPDLARKIIRNQLAVDILGTWGDPVTGVVGTHAVLIGTANILCTKCRCIIEKDDARAAVSRVKNKKEKTTSWVAFCSDCEISDD